MSKSKESKLHEIDKVMKDGGVIYIEGVKVFIDNPNNLDVIQAPTGYWVTNAMGWKTYFKTVLREDAQKACNKLYGFRAYIVNSKV